MTAAAFDRPVCPRIIVRIEFRSASNRRETLEELSALTFEQLVLWIISRIAGGLAHAHERGILHRDLKPANILMTDDGQPMILDFNLSDDLASPGNSSSADWRHAAVHVPRTFARGGRTRDASMPAATCTRWA